MKADDFDLNRVAIFIAIAEARGVNAAAAQLKLPKSSVSRSLTQLEKELGAELVVRSNGRQFDLTDAGRAFFDSASSALTSLKAAREGIRRETAAPRGLIRIAAPPALATWLVAPFVARFVRQFPEVDVDLTATSKKHMSPMRDGFDVILTHGGPVTGQLKDSAAKSRSLGTVDGGVFASPTYLRERGTPRRPSDLLRHDCVLHGPAKAGWHLIGAGGTSEQVAVTGRIRVDDIFTSTAAAVAGGGLAVLPVHAAQMDPLAKTLVRVLSDYVVRGDTAFVLFSPSRHVPLRVKLFVDALVETSSQTCTEHSTVTTKRTSSGANGHRPTAPALA